MASTPPLQGDVDAAALVFGLVLEACRIAWSR
jgi:hypothetical protein